MELWPCTGEAISSSQALEAHKGMAGNVFSCCHFCKQLAALVPGLFLRGLLQKRCAGSPPTVSSL